MQTEPIGPKRSRRSTATQTCLAALVGFAVAVGRTVVVHLPVRSNTPAIIQEVKAPAVDLTNGILTVTRRHQQDDQSDTD